MEKMLNLTGTTRAIIIDKVIDINAAKKSYILVPRTCAKSDSKRPGPGTALEIWEFALSVY